MSLKRLFFIISLVFPLLTGVGHASQALAPSGPQAESGFIVQMDTGQGSRHAGFIPFNDLFSERRLMLPAVKGPITLRLIKQGFGPGHVDLVRVDGCEALAVRGVQDIGKHYLLGAKDFDVVHCPEGPQALELDFPAGGELVVAARVEGPRDNEEPFRFPTSNLFRAMTADRDFYRVAPSSTPARVFAENTLPGTGHPIGMTSADAWIEKDRLRVQLNFESDNTLDGGADYASLHLRKNGEVKTCTVSTQKTEYGHPLFVYTGDVPWRHKVYEFDVALAELGVTPGEPLDLAFSAYGTSGPGPYDPSAAYGDQNREYMVAYNQEYDNNGTQEWQVQTQRFDSSGEMAGSSLGLSLQDDMDKGDYALSYDSVNNKFLVLWSYSDRETIYLVYRNMVDADNMNTTTPVAFPSISEEYSPACAFSRTSARHLALWHEGTNSNVDGYLVNPDNSLFGSRITLTPDLGDQFGPRVTWNSIDDSFLVVWTDTRNSESYYDIYGQIVLPDGTLSGSNIQLAANPGTAEIYSSTIDISPGGGGRALLIWSDTWNGNPDIRGRILAGDMTPQGADSFAISTDTTSRSALQVAYAGYRRFLVTWEDWSTFPDIIYGQYVSDSGELLGGKMRFSPEGIYPNDNALTGNRHGRCLVTFVNSNVPELATTLAVTPFPNLPATTLQLLND